MAKKKKSTEVDETDSAILREVAKDNNKPRLARSVKKDEETGQREELSGRSPWTARRGLKGE